MSVLVGDAPTKAPFVDTRKEIAVLSDGSTLSWKGECNEVTMLDKNSIAYVVRFSDTGDGLTIRRLNEGRSDELELVGWGFVGHTIQVR